MGLKIGFFFNSALPNLIIKDKFFKNLLRICGGLLKTLLSMISLLNKVQTSFTFQIQLYYSPGTVVIFFQKGSNTKPYLWDSKLKFVPVHSVNSLPVIITFVLMT